MSIYRHLHFTDTPSKFLPPTGSAIEEKANLIKEVNVAVPTDVNEASIADVYAVSNPDMNEAPSTDVNSTPTTDAHTTLRSDIDATTFASVNETTTENYTDASSSTGQRQAGKIVRDSINVFHWQNFIPPENETCQKRFPACIVIGVAKCGTRELIDFLRIHPHIEIYHGRSIYEMPYFRRNRVYKKGPNWLKNQMPCSYSNQVTLMKNAWYFHSNQTPERIYNFNQTIKLILLVREPVSRSISLYKFLQNRVGVDKRKTFSEYVLNTKNNNLNTKHKLIKMSVYDKSMELWLNYFNLSQILIIESEKLQRDPPTVLKRVEEFLGLGHYIRPDMFVYNTEKQFFCIRSHFTSTGMACYADNRGRTHIPTESTVSTEMIAQLKEYFEPRTKRFFELIGKSFDW